MTRPRIRLTGMGLRQPIRGDAIVGREVFVIARDRHGEYIASARIVAGEVFGSDGAYELVLSRGGQRPASDVRFHPLPEATLLAEALV